MTATLERTLTLAEYGRVSFDASGRERSIDEQHVENERGLERIGARFGSTDYADVGSASRYARKRRAGFDDLVADLTADRFDADGLVIWESSRGSRRVSEWLALLELCAQRGKVIAVTTHGPRVYDPSNDRDWRALVDDAVDAEYESRKTSSRVGRSMKASAEAGAVPGGRRPFGYRADDRSKLDEREAAITRDLVARVLAGQSTRSLAADLNRRGVLTSAGNAWHPGVVRQMVSSPRIAGLRVHRGAVVGKGQWAPIITEAQHRRVVAMLAKSTAPTRGRSPWALTGFLRCEHCGSALVGNIDSVGKSGDKGTRRYVCRKAPGYHGCGRLVVSATGVEDALGKLATARLVDRDLRARAAAPDDAEEFAELDAIKARRIEVADLYARNPKLSLEQRAADVDALDRYEVEVRARIKAKQVESNAALDLVAAEGLIGKAWADLSVEQRRLVLTALVDHVTVGPATVRGSNRFETARVTGPGRIVWRA